jgi:hypothetical protein
MMTMTDEELKLSFRRFNEAFFSGVIPEMPVMFRDTMYGKGSFECLLKESKMPYAVQMIPGTGAIEINEQCKREDEWEPVLLHEMVHAYFAAVGLGHELHGPRFHAKCEKIEEVLGVEIPRPKA